MEPNNATINEIVEAYIVEQWKHIAATVRHPLSVHITTQASKKDLRYQSNAMPQKPAYPSVERKYP
jgi:hypothetical protein